LKRLQVNRQTRPASQLLWSQ